MAAPKWIDTVKSAIPFVLGSASVVATFALEHGVATSPAAWETLLVGMGVNIASGALAALCRPDQLNAGKEYEQVLANHDIVRLVRTAWGEAAVATIKAYWKAHGNPNHGYLEASFKAAKPEDFEPQGITVKTIHEAIAESRRAFVTASPAEQPNRTETVAAELQQQLVDSVCDLMSERWSFSAIPDELKSYLAEHLPRQLFLHVAYYLKTDQRAQTAILHFTLQEIQDGQGRMQDGLNRLCAQFTDTEKRIGSEFAAQLEKQNEKLRAMMGEVVDQAFNRDRQPLLDPPFIESSSKTTDFTFRARVTGLVGREDALADLTDFVSDERPGLWTIVSGAAGTGKNRLVAELVGRVRDPFAPDNSVVPAGQWRAGFVRRPEDWLVKTDHAARWVPAADTLLVIDYASDLSPKPLADFLAHLDQSQKKFQSVGFKYRVVLIDRARPREKQIGLLERLNDSRAEQLLWESKSLELNPVGTSDAVQIAQSAAGGRWNKGFAELAGNAFVQDPDLARPLFAFLLGDAIRSGDTPGELNPVTVSKAALKRAFHGVQGPFSSEAKMLLVAATVGQGIPLPALTDEVALQALTGKSLAADGDLEQLQDQLRRLAVINQGELVAPLEPDFLGELFVLERLLELPEARGQIRVEALMACAWKNGKDPSAFLIRFANDALKRTKQISDSFNVPVTRVTKLVDAILKSGLGRANYSFLRGQSAALIAYAAARNSRQDLVDEIIGGLKSLCSEFGERAATELATTYFALTAVQPDPAHCDALAGQIGLIRGEHDTAEIALEQAKALRNATVGQPDPAHREALAGQIGLIRGEHDTAEIALQQAKALLSASVVQPDPDRRKAVLVEIIEIAKHYTTLELGKVETLVRSILESESNAR